MTSLTLKLIKPWLVSWDFSINLSVLLALLCTDSFFFFRFGFEDVLSCILSSFYVQGLIPDAEVVD